MLHLAPRVTGAALCTLFAGTSCLSAGQAGPADTTPSAVSPDSSRFLVPAGYGSLRQEDIAIRIQRRGLQVQAIPLDETIIRLLSPDSYRALREQINSRAAALEELSRRTGLRGFSVWLVRFHGVEQGETIFSPMEFIVTSVGRDFRPIDVLPVTPGFGQQRLRQREVQTALYVFDPQVNVNQPLVVQYETGRNADWSVVLTRIERERVLVRSRAGIRDLPPTRRPTGP
ncbi:MAG TPA: hypothetical protein VF981_04160 [Gemmatimonadaceae bacterium]